MVADPTVAKSYYNRQAEEPASKYVSPDDAQKSIDKIYADLNTEIANVIASIDAGVASNEVHVSPTGPTAPAIELWIDTDENYTSNTSFSRTTSSITTPSLAAGAAGAMNFTLSNSYRLYKITTSAPCRFRMYTTAGKRTSDSSRPITTPPTGDHGLAFEFVSSLALLGSDIIPAVDGYDGKDTPDGIIPVLITNQGTGSSTITITLIWIRTE